jgi:2-polyprenyl-6-hydroxyphenyl methylase/3-demethylubiquinone-9 3-methyltransferase
VPSREYHERLWEGLPEPLHPPDLALRRAFLLEGVRELGVAEHELDVLDVGCGEGQLTAELAGAGTAVVGIDVAEEALRRARSQHPSLDLRIVPADGTWPLEDSSFDVVWAGETIEHVADTATWLSEVWRVLRPGGTLLLSTPAHGRLRMLVLALSGRAFDAHFDPRSDHLRFYSRRSLARQLEELGFERVRVRTAGGPPGARRALLATARRAPS